MKKIKSVIVLMLAAVMMLALLCACGQKLPANGGEANSFSDSSADAPFGSEASGGSDASGTEESSGEESGALNENYFQSSVML